MLFISPSLIPVCWLSYFYEHLNQSVRKVKDTEKFKLVQLRSEILYNIFLGKSMELHHFENFLYCIFPLPFFP